MEESVVSAEIAARKPSISADPLWYKDAVIYQLHVRAFLDLNEDGHGDFPGLTSKLDYIKDLGVNTVWLLPFYPSPLKDDGYDVADYHNIHPQYGTRQDFRTFMREAHGRGLRVITELVVNHTSDQHPWFQAARRAPAGSSKRNYYVWSDSDQKYRGTRIIFTDTETSNWTWDPVAKAYYWHRFFSHQPDLNFDNPSVLKTVFRAMRFWLDMGVDGFRLDAIPYLVEREGTSNENLPETHAVIKRIRALVDEHYPDRALLAEANQWPEDVREYFGDGDECHMAYHFPLMPRMYMAIAQEDRHPIIEILQQTPETPPSCQWAIFLRNHDELTLEMVTSKERDYMYRMYAADSRARLNLGIRRRLAALMENDPDRIKLMNSMLLSMPGSPIIYYGDEIGMGDNIFLGDRNGVRTPMQWSPDRNAGFSRADPQRLFLPPIMDAVYGYQAVNVEAQARDPSSLLNWMRRMLAVRKTSQAFGRGRLSFLKPGNRKVLAYLREAADDVILCVCNVARSAQPVELDLKRFRGRVPVEMLGRTAFPPIGELPYLLTLPAYGFYWFRLATDVEMPQWHAEQHATEDIAVLVLFDGWTSFFRDRVVPWRIGLAEKVREQLECQALPRYIEARRWYAAKGVPIRRAQLVDHGFWQARAQTWLISRFDALGDGEPVAYFLPLALAWDNDDEERIRRLTPGAVVRVRQQAQVGVLADALFDATFCRAVVEAIGSGCEVPMTNGVVHFSRFGTSPAGAEYDTVQLEVSPPLGHSSNSVVTLGERWLLKVYRRLRPGLNPEIEMGRFLTEVAHFAHSVPTLGALEYKSNDGTRTALAVLQAYVPNSGDGWTWAADYAERFLESHRMQAEAPAPDVHGGFVSLVQTLATRTAELHLALARPAGDPAFNPERFTVSDLTAWKERVHVDLDATLGALAARRPVPAAEQGEQQQFIDARDHLLGLIDETSLPSDGISKIRTHGDYHLGQLLMVKNDFMIIDFEGEPGRTLAERRAKHLSVRDVAGMLRSFDYARCTALRRAAPTDEQSKRLETLAAAWLGEIRHAFLESYASRMHGSECFAAFDEVQSLLDLAELEKVLYELRYELANRPAWVGVPLAGGLALVERHQSTGT